MTVASASGSGAPRSGRGRSWHWPHPASPEKGFVIMTAKASARVDPLKLVSRLIECGKVDTVYRDVYLGRGRTLLGGELSAEEFRRTLQQEAELARTLAPAIGRAIEKADWTKVEEEPSSRAEALRRSVEGQRGRIETAPGGLRGHRRQAGPVLSRPRGVYAAGREGSAGSPEAGGRAPGGAGDGRCAVEDLLRWPPGCAAGPHPDHLRAGRHCRRLPRTPGRRRSAL